MYCLELICFSTFREKGSKVLVHCKMGISRSASVVIAYAMKAFNMSLEEALSLVKKKRSCIKPNKAFCGQLKTYEVRNFFQSLTITAKS